MPGAPSSVLAPRSKARSAPFGSRPCQVMALELLDNDGASLGTDLRTKKTRMC